MYHQSYFSRMWKMWIGILYIRHWFNCHSCSQVTHLFDNGATVFFAVFMAVWGKCSTFVWLEFPSFALLYVPLKSDFEYERKKQSEFSLAVLLDTSYLINNSFGLFLRWCFTGQHVFFLLSLPTISSAFHYWSKIHLLLETKVKVIVYQKVWWLRPDYTSQCIWDFLMWVEYFHLTSVWILTHF